MKKIAVLISGSGSNLEAIIDACNQNIIDGDVIKVISNNPKAYGLVRAKKFNISSETINHKNFDSREDFDQALEDSLVQINHDVIVTLAQNNDIFAVLTCIGCLSALVMILRKKRKQLPAGRARNTWAFLMSVSILMFASASLVVALQNSSTLEISDEIAWSSLLVVAGAIGWAWPKGRHIIEEVADEIIDVAV